MSNAPRAIGAGQGGFALILAIMALLLLTTLGLTLATTTTTEVQIAANYRYSRQALYNAEAGMQVARYVLARLAAQDPNDPAEASLPTYRGGIPWAEGAAPAPTDANPNPNVPDYYPHIPGPGCDSRGGVGYGKVLIDTDGVTTYNNISTWNGQPLMGTFTVWIRRPLLSQSTGLFVDEVANDVVTVTVRGTAPYTAGVAINAAARQFQAERILEATLRLTSAKANPCGGSGLYQSGRDQLGTNWDPCSTLSGADFASGWLDVP